MDVCEESNVNVRPRPNPGFTVDLSKVILVDGRYAYVGGMNLGGGGHIGTSGTT